MEEDHAAARGGRGGCQGAESWPALEEVRRKVAVEAAAKPTASNGGGGDPTRGFPVQQVPPPRWRWRYPCRRQSCRRGPPLGLRRPPTWAPPVAPPPVPWEAVASRHPLPAVQPEKQGRMSGRWSQTIYVGNLHGDIKEREVEDLFYKVGGSSSLIHLLLS